MSNISVDDSKVQNLFRALDDEVRKKILLSAMKEGASKLAEETRLQLKTKLGSGASSTLKRGKPMERGIRVKTDKDYCEVDVNIMGDFRLKWFERGTKPRQTKKKANRGSVRALYFFKSARTNADEVSTVISNSIAESLRRISKE